MAISDNSKTVFQIGIDSLGSMIHPHKQACRIDDELVEAKAFMSALRLSLEKVASILGPDVPEDLIRLTDEACYSDPVSSLGSKEIEEQILSDVSCLLEPAGKPAESLVADICDVRAKLRIRNSIVAAGKQA